MRKITKNQFSIRNVIVGSYIRLDFCTTVLDLADLKIDISDVNSILKLLHILNTSFLVTKYIYTSSSLFIKYMWEIIKNNNSNFLMNNLVTVWMRRRRWL